MKENSQFDNPAQFDGNDSLLGTQYDVYVEMGEKDKYLTTAYLGKKDFLKLMKELKADNRFLDVKISYKEKTGLLTKDSVKKAYKRCVEEYENYGIDEELENL